MDENPYQALADSGGGSGGPAEFARTIRNAGILLSIGLAIGLIGHLVALWTWRLQPSAFL
jgi:hypothetical protein